MLKNGQLTIEDFSHYPVTDVSSFNYKIKTLPVQIKEHFWLLEYRDLFGTLSFTNKTPLFLLTKIQVLAIIKSGGDEPIAIDCFRFINGSWNRLILRYANINGFNTNNENAHYLFKDLESAKTMATQFALKGKKVKNISDARILSTNLNQVLHTKPIFLGDRKIGGKSGYMRLLAKEFNWHNGAVVGLHGLQLIKNLLTDNPELNILGFDSFELPMDEFGFSLIQGGSQNTINKFKNAAKHLANEMQPRFNVMKTDDPTAIADHSLDFVIFQNTLDLPSIINNWKPKVKSGGTFVGSKINYERISKVIDVEFPNWIRGQSGIWFSQA